jgi:repressor of nif and glnA expression
MRGKTSKIRVAILRALRDASEPVGSAQIAREIESTGFEISPRSIRLYMQEMEAAGLVAPARRGRKGGRIITPTGIEEIQNAFVADRVGLMSARVDSLSARMTFNLDSGRGRIVLNVTVVDEAAMSAAVQVMLPVFRAGFGMGEFVAVAHGGEMLGDYQVPMGCIGIGTVCSVTLNGVMLSERIPMSSRFGGVLEVGEGRPERFTDVIFYEGTSLDPLEIFIRGGLTSVCDAARTGYGRIGASFREVPSDVLDALEAPLRRLERMGLGGVLLRGKPNQPLLDFPVSEGRTGIIVAGGLNPPAAIHEQGIPVENTALSTLYEFEKMIHYSALTKFVGN